MLQVSPSSKSSSTLEPSLTTFFSKLQTFNKSCWLSPSDTGQKPAMSLSLLALFIIFYRILAINLELFLPCCQLQSWKLVAICYSSNRKLIHPYKKFNPTTSNPLPNTPWPFPPLDFLQVINYLLSCYWCVLTGMQAPWGQYEQILGLFVHCFNS